MASYAHCPLADLKELANTLSVKTYGTKADLIGRISQHAEGVAALNQLTSNEKKEKKRKKEKEEEEEEEEKEDSDGIFTVPEKLTAKFCKDFEIKFVSKSTKDGKTAYKYIETKKADDGAGVSPKNKLKSVEGDTPKKKVSKKEKEVIVIDDEEEEKAEAEAERKKVHKKTPKEKAAEAYAAANPEVEAEEEDPEEKEEKPEEETEKGDCGGMMDPAYEEEKEALFEEHFDFFLQKLKKKLFHERHLANQLLHKYQPSVPLKNIKQLSDSQIYIALAKAMYNDDDDE